MGRVVSLETGAVTRISTQGKCRNDIHRNAEQTQSCIAKKKRKKKTQSKILARGSNDLECKHAQKKKIKKRRKKEV